MKKSVVITFTAAIFFVAALAITLLLFNGEKPPAMTDSEYDISGEKGQNEISGTTGSECEESEVRVKTGDGYHELYNIISATYGYIGDGAFAADTGPRLHNLINAGDTDELPLIAWDEGFSIDVPENLDILSIECMTADGKIVLGLYADAVKREGVELKENGLENYKEYFSELSQGVYYVAVEVYRQGRYIEAENEYEYSLEQYAFSLNFSGD